MQTTLDAWLGEQNAAGYQLPTPVPPRPQEGTSWVGHNMNNYTSSPGAEYFKELKMPVKCFIFRFRTFL